jgi:hypothetical protein
MRTNSHDWRLRASTAALVASIAALSIVGCGGDSGGGQRPPDTHVTGVAATGAPLANATVTLKDATGKSATATTAADGSFSVVSTGLKPPYLLRVPAPQGNLYSVSANDGATTVINVTTLTDLATRVWFTLNGSSSLDAVFQSPPGTAFPAPSQVEYVEALIDDVFELWLRDAGVDPSASNLISTPFKADGTGVDRVLGQTRVNGWVITVTGLVPTAGSAKVSVAGAAPRAAADVERTQVSTLSFDTNEKSVTVESAVTAGTEVSTTVATTVLPTTTTMETAFEQIDANIKSIAETANQKGLGLTADDLLPFVDPEYLSQGLNGQEWADLMVAQIKLTAGATFGGYVIDLDQLDTVNGTAHGHFTLTVTQNGQTATNREESRFRLVNGKWLLSGDGRPAWMYVKAETGTDSSGWGMNVMANASTREGVYVAATVSGWQWTDLPMIEDDATSVDEADHRFRGFWYGTDYYDAADLPPAGTPFTFKLQPVSGPQEEYVVTMNAATNALVWITSAPDGAARDVIGQRVTLAWTLPTTVVIDEVNVQGVVHAGIPEDVGTECDIWGETLGKTAISGSITIPTTCDDQTVIWVELTVNIEGVNGEEMSAMRSYH